MSNSYQRIPQSVDDASPPELAPPVIDPTDTSVLDSTDAADRSYRPLRESIRSEFNRPPPATWKRVLLVLAVLLMGYVAVKLGGKREKKPQVIYASRYSEEHKYRPAASPVITEYLKDGRIRLRGASPGGVGVREEDLPMSKERKAVQEKKRVDEAKAAAAKMLKEKRQAIKEKRSKRKAKKRGGKAAGKSEI